MIKLQITLVPFFLFINLLFAQDTTKAFYFPHKTGDMWEYYYYDGPSSVDTLQNFIVFDSTDSNGIIFMKQHAQFINPIRPSTILLEDSTNFWVDTVNNYVWGRDKYVGDSSLIYKLNVNKREQWIVSNVELGGNYYQMARVTDKWKGTLLNKPTTFMSISYYIAQDSTDTTGIIELGSDEIGDGFGLIYRGGADSPGEIQLIGAVISDRLYGDTTVVSVTDKKTILPSTFKLFQNYPNPFNPSTTIQYEIPKESFVKIIVYDILGREVEELLDEEKPAGEYEIKFNAKNLPSGIYFYQLKARTFIETKKMIFLK